MRQWTVALGFSLLAVAAARAADWPAWRGPAGTGVAADAHPPLEWSAEKNVAWEVPLRGEGNSAAIVVGDQVLLSCATDGGRMRSLMSYDRATGELRWAKTVRYGGEEKTHNTNPFCSSSPASDGQRVVVWHGSAGLHCYDMQGEPLWNVDLGEFQHIWGNASSPVLYGDLVVLNAGPGTRSFLIALNKSTGEEVWRRETPDAASEKVDEFRGSWSTPVLFQENGRDLMALSLPKRLIAFDPKTGETVWSSEGLSLLSYTSPLIGDDLVVAMCGYHGPAIAVKRGGAGDITESHRLWTHTNKNPQRVGSGVLVDGHVYILNEDGVAWCIDAVSGENKWKERLGGKAWSSMSHVDGKLHALNMDGTTFVLKPNPAACEVLAENHLDELTRSSHAFSDGQVFIRTYKHLWCVQAP
ncbi:MAG: PQQ-binding-like beta-propeller repeat protein [Planctomycetales bacterium]|nr:PQQ-binding-like beta-propeller repeat protein [Planctomycetales bacterium]